MSRSGAIYKPNISMSSPVFTTIDMSSGSIARLSPSRSFEAPTPPASAVIMEKGSSLRPCAFALILSAEQIPLSRSNQRPRIAFPALVLVAPHDDYRYSRGLAHQQSRCGGQIIGYCEHGGREFFTVIVELTSEVDKRIYSGDADRHIRQAFTPG